MGSDPAVSDGSLLRDSLFISSRYHGLISGCHQVINSKTFCASLTKLEMRDLGCCSIPWTSSFSSSPSSPSSPSSSSASLAAKLCGDGEALGPAPLQRLNAGSVDVPVQYSSSIHLLSRWWQPPPRPPPPPAAAAAQRACISPDSQYWSIQSVARSLCRDAAWWPPLCCVLPHKPITPLFDLQMHFPPNPSRTFLSENQFGLIGHRNWVIPLRDGQIFMPVS